MQQITRWTRLTVIMTQILPTSFLSPQLLEVWMKYLCALMSA
eukprot:gene48169-62975_t